MADAEVVLLWWDVGDFGRIDGRKLRWAEGGSGGSLATKGFVDDQLRLQFHLRLLLRWARGYMLQF